MALGNGRQEDRQGCVVALVGLLVAFERMDAFEVREHDVPVEGVAVHGKRVLHDGVGDTVLVVIGEVGAASGTGLGERHATSLARPSLAIAVRAAGDVRSRRWLR